jgi:methionyl-tRNA formyltransferase
MRIVFMGTPEFAVSSLEILIKSGFDVVAVITAPDKPAGRGQKIKQSAVKEFAIKQQIKTLQPTNLKDSIFISELKALKADLQIVVAFRMLPEIIWDMPKLGTYNLHASLLPKYRGAAPINWAIINNEKETGVTTFKIKQVIDTGNILYREKINLNSDITAGELHDQLMKIGAELLLKTVVEINKNLIEGTELNFISQNDENTYHAPKITKELCKINWNKSGDEIYNLIRGLSPYPTAMAYLNNGDDKPSIIKIYNSSFKIIEHNYDNGLLITDNKTFLNVYCKNGIIQINDLQIEGKKRLLIADFLRGIKLKTGAKLV